ncbi:rho GTPase-activating protein 21 isoform X3 [Adelges cooleyi]|uniref:rho GTPase-activating protein 21 isoform X3 n=1 Tax=Adelges cooleyi TaxID=133065 RepID=UPI00217FD19C|nr:rho GTPase-activating protein 21 isoform X3 [Adelges cooleyi]
MRIFSHHHHHRRSYRLWHKDRPTGQNRESRASSGPRSLFIRRSENGFGFTLRHFIVYPPESYLVLAGDERLGLRRGACVRPDEPMDTIFVKQVKDNGPASLAGLNTGDRIISVNGETVAGKSYAHVVQLIQQTRCSLYLLVVPMENDILQLYFSETAHNPETNQRPGRLKAAMTSGNELRFHRGRDSSPIYQNPWDRGVAVKSSSAAARFVSPHRTPNSRRSSAADTHGGSYRNKANPNSRHSMDVGVACRDALLAADNHQYGGHASSTAAAPDDSVIISRIKKSLEQKEEFLRRPVQSAKEFYSRPQKLSAPLWPPPVSSTGQQQSPPQSAAKPAPHQQPVPPVAPSKLKSKQFVNTLSKINEDAAKKQQPGCCTAAAGDAAAADHLKQANLQVVSMRAKQFESGKIDDKTDFYRSELARLSSKHNVPNVAVRKMEYEQKLCSEKKKSTATAPHHQQYHQDGSSSRDDSLSSCSSDKSYVDASADVPYHSGNLIVPIGSNKIHCDPPKEFDQSKDEPPVAKDESYRFKPVVRQDSYLAACKKPTIIERRSQRPMVVENGGISSDKKNHRRCIRPTRLELPKDRPVDFAVHSSGSSQVSTEPSADTVEQSPSEIAAAAVKLRTNLIDINDEERTTRRISYLKATAWGDRMSVDDLSTTTESESEPTTVLTAINKLGSSKKSVAGPPFQDLGNSRVVKEGSLLCKVILLDGKKAGDRSWKPVWAVVRGQTLCLYKDKQRETAPNVSAVETPAPLDKTDDVNMSCDQINLLTSTTAVAQDYVKRKHVMRLSSAEVGCTELLLQADDTSSMVRWLKALQEQALEAPASLSAEECASISPGNTKGIRKLATFRNRSPTGDSPITKTRKPDRSPSQTQPQSPKSTNTWKNRMAKQLKKIQQGSGSPVSPIMPTLPPPPGTTIGIPLELCPPSTQSECVPLIVEVCTSIVEDKGLDIIGIYRVPGNTAAITSLTEAVNTGGMETPEMAAKLLQRDPRWTDVNVISSLLKSFFRRLPEALLTTEMYPHFIEADKIDDPVQRMVKLRELVHKLPEHHFETLKYLLMHLKKVVHHSGVNKMEARNLAIVFGPTLVHSADNNMVTMVTDMSHQCRIVESLILQADWCYGNGDVADLKASIPENCGQVPEIEQAAPNQNLLDNINKVSGNQYTPFIAKDLVTNIVAAANRKMHRATGKSSSGSRKSRSNTSNVVLQTSSMPSTSDIKQGMSDKDKLNSSKASSETVSTASLNESEDSLNRLGNPNSDSSSQNTDCGAPIKSYVNLAETTQERIRRFEQETKAMLEREKSRSQRRREYFGVDEPVMQTSNALLLAKDYPPIMVKVSKGTPNGGSTFDQTKSEADSKNNQKRLKTSNDNTDTWSEDSLNDISRGPKERPVSHVSDEGGDLLVSLTSAFDKKLKSLLIPSDSATSCSATSDVVDDKQSQQKSSKSEDEQTDVQTYRDPSLHRSLERRSQHITEKHETETMKDSASESVKNSPKTESPSSNRLDCLQDFNASSNVRLRRSESLKQKENRPDYSNHVKLRRCESLNKHERYTPKYTKFEVMMLTKNGDASKHRRSDSLSKTEKTECNMNKRKQGLSRRCSSLRDKEARQKRKNGVATDRSIKRRHTVGGTKDFDKITWLDNKEKEELDKCGRKEQQLRTSSPDLSWERVVGGLKETGIRPRSVATDPNYVSKLLNVPLESHV